MGEGSNPSVMELSIIASGSNGNCYLLQASEVSVLFDAGKSYAETARRMAPWARTSGRWTASSSPMPTATITRGSDRSREGSGFPFTSAKRSIRPAGARWDRSMSAISKTAFRVGDMEITPVETCHDVASCGFVVGRFGMFTDTGCVTSRMREVIRDLDTVLLESNYDEGMLMTGPYPWSSRSASRPTGAT